MFPITVLFLSRWFSLIHFACIAVYPPQLFIRLEQSRGSNSNTGKLDQAWSNFDPHYYTFYRPGTHRVDLLPSNSELSAGERRTTYPLLLFVTNHVVSWWASKHIQFQFLSLRRNVTKLYHLWKRNTAFLLYNQLWRMKMALSHDRLLL